MYKAKIYLGSKGTDCNIENVRNIAFSLLVLTMLYSRGDNHINRLSMLFDLNPELIQNVAFKALFELA